MKQLNGILILLTSLGLMACGSDDPEEPVDGAGGAENMQPDGTPETPFSFPESARWDADREQFYVSNIGGDPQVPDGIGWISRVDAKGNILEERWIEGFDAPKGLALCDGFLYVTDVNQIVEIDIEAAEITQRVAIEGAQFLNDAAFGHGAVWVTDTFTGSVIRWEPGVPPEIFLQDMQLMTANGIVVEDERLVVVSIGDLQDAKILGAMWTVDLESKTIAQLGNAQGKFDGIEPFGNGYLLTDFRGQLLFSTTEGVLTVLEDLTADGLASSADLGVSEAGQVIVPDLLGSQIWTGTIDETTLP